MKRAYESLLTFDVALSLKLLTRHIPTQGEADLREFSWNYLWRTLHREQRRFPRHPGDVYAVALSPDGQQLATACRDGKTRVWDYATSRFEFELEGHTGEVRAVSFSRDGTRLVTGGDDGYAIIWDLGERQPIARLLHDNANERPVTSVMLSPEGERLYTAAGINLVCWDVSTGERINSLTFFSDHIIRSASLSPDGRYLAAAVVVLQAYRTDTWERVFVGADAKKNDWSAVQFLEDSNQFAASGRWRNLEIFDVNQDEPIFSRRLTSENHTASVPSNAKRRILAIGNRNNAVHIVSSDPAIEREAVFLGHTSRIWDVKFVNDGSSVVSAGADGEVIVWPAPIDAYWSQPNGILLPYENPKLKLRCLTYSPDGRRLVFGGDEPSLRVLDCLTGQIDELPNSGVASAVAFLPNGKNIVYGAQAGEHGLQLYDLESKRGKRLTELADDLTNVSVSPRGDLLAFACGNAAHVLALPSGKLIRSMQTDKESITAIGFSPSGECFAILTGPELVIYESATWQRTLNISAGEGQFLDIDFFPDGKRMVVAEGENGAAIREVATGRLLSQHLGHPGLVDTVAVAPDGQHIASVCGKVMLQIWDTRSEQSLMHFEDLKGSPRGIQFSPRGGELAIVQDRSISNLTILDARPIVVTEPLPPISTGR
jgi:WD40 repeat protein